MLLPPLARVDKYLASPSLSSCYRDFPVSFIHSSIPYLSIYAYSSAIYSVILGLVQSTHRYQDKMVAFEDPESPSLAKEEGLHTGWDSTSPPETAVNTAAPSRAPSTHGESSSTNAQNADIDLEAGQNEKPTPNPLSCVDPVTHIVSWDGPDDPENPMNFPRSKKWRITMVTAIMTFCVSFASSVFSTATEVTAVKWGVSLEVMILGVSLYVLGFACGKQNHSYLSPIIQYLNSKLQHEIPMQRIQN